MTDTAEALTEVLLAPLREVGTMLAEALDETREEVRQLRSELAEARADLRAHRQDPHAHD